MTTKMDWDVLAGLPIGITSVASLGYFGDLQSTIDFLTTSYSSVFIDGELQLNNLATVIATILGPVTAGYAYKNGVNTFGRVAEHQYFEEKEFTNIPTNRPGYSDRIAYCLAELSDLAYLEIQQQPSDIHNILDVISSNSQLNTKQRSLINNLLSPLNSNVQTTRQKLADILNVGGYTLIGDFNKQETQGFVCSKRGDNPYIVVAFRGTEKRVGDWLTNAQAAPEPVQGGKVHSGFNTAFGSVKKQIENILIAEQQRFGEHKVPVYFTGHSLGGALATLAARDLSRNNEIFDANYGACYTFGAPRIGDYAFFEYMKTPVYRVVNSADLVPRVPPGALSTLLLHLIKLCSYLTSSVKPLSRLIASTEGLLNKLKDYRHHGDLRYLTDKPSGSKQLPKLLANPNQLDVVQWFFRHTLVSFGMPVKSHSMKLYRNKLLDIAKHRIQQKQEK